MSRRSITFVTGNKKKLEVRFPVVFRDRRAHCEQGRAQEVVAILGSSFPFEVVNHSLDLPELQGEADDVCKEKCRMASKNVRARGRSVAGW